MNEKILKELVAKVLDFIYQNGNGSTCYLEATEFKVDVFYFWVSGVFFYTEVIEKSTWDYPGSYDAWLTGFDLLSVFYQHQDKLRDDDLVLTAKELSFFKSELLK